MDVPVTDFVYSASRVFRRDDPSDMPSLSDSSSSSSVATPSMYIPSAEGNPYILRQHNMSGTVFIAVGAIVGAILLGFVLYHLVVSLAALRMAKRSVVSGRLLQEKYLGKNHNAISGSGSLLPFGNDYTKLPFLLLTRSQGTGFGSGDNLTIYGSDIGSTSKQDLTKMFISPTAEVMHHKRARLSVHGAWVAPANSNGSQANSSIPTSAAGSLSNLQSSSAGAAGNRASYVPGASSSLMYVSGRDDDISEDASLHLPSLLGVSDTTLRPSQGRAGRAGHGTIPSVYLEDLMGDQSAR